MELGGFQARTLEQITADLVAWQESGFSNDGMALPPIFGIVRLISSTIDQVPITVDDGPPPLWLRSPRRFGSALDLGDLIQFVVTGMALKGSANLQCVRVGDSWQIDALHPGSVQHQASTSGVVSLRYVVDGNEMPVVPPYMGQWQEGRPYLLHIPYLVTPQHPAGCSPITVARESVLGYFAVERQASNLLDQGTHSGGRLETDQDITVTTAERYQDKWMLNRKEGKIPVTGSGLHYINDLISPRDAQWLESRAFNMQQLCAMYGVPVDYVGLAMAGGVSSLSYANAQDNDRRFKRNCLLAFTTQIEDALTTLMPLGRTPDEAQRVEFDFTAWEETTSGNQDAPAEPPPAGGEGR